MATDSQPIRCIRRSGDSSVWSVPLLLRNLNLYAGVTLTLTRNQTRSKEWTQINKFVPTQVREQYFS
jgi:hypothetical protein